MMTTRKNNPAGLAIRLALLAGWAWLVARGDLAGLDHLVAARLAGPHPLGLEAMVKAVSFLGSSLFTAVAAAALAVVEWNRRGRRAVIPWAVALAAGLAIEVALRGLVGHWRPDVAVVPSSLTLIERITLAGFPSGHAFRSAVLLAWAASLWPSCRWAGLGALGCIGATRPYLGRHWASDVVGGWLVAWLVTPRPDRSS